MASDFKLTSIWQRTLGRSPEKGEEDGLSRLRSVYDTFRTRAAQLTAQIAATLPGLTMHDITHLDALWETADLIAGPDYPMNPMEGFVLGGAILLHDAALCFEAFEAGKEGVRGTTEWKDSLEAEKTRNGNASVADMESLADFSTLRSLHAKQAKSLGQRSWKTPSGNDIYLIDDSELRERYGALIGLIAASHHWPIEDVESKLPVQANAPAKYPREWRIDPVKIACLLRCADAAHIDDRRAPDFLYALARRQGLSAEHWKAQNWLARADIDQSDASHESILFTSNREFGPTDVEAWWIAYDSISLVGAEILASHNLLESRPQKQTSPPFRVRKVTGLTSPGDLAKHVRVVGWMPCAATIHVSNLEKLVGSLGGSTLYGTSDALAVALRELLQNSRDAVLARHVFSHDFVPRVIVRLRRLESGDTLIDVEDNGIGMSERVLTGPLLDFGNSFWISDLVRQEFPGLRSSRFRPIGRFGIGFYSIFMIASEVIVTTRRWDFGLDETRILRFPNGLTLRPTLSRGRPTDLSPETVTRVRCRLKEGFLDQSMIEINPAVLGEKPFPVPVLDYISVLTAGLDVTVEFSGPGDEGTSIAHEKISDVNTSYLRSKWLERLSFAAHRSHGEGIDASVYARRLRFVTEGDAVYGLAALSIHRSHGPDFLSVSTVGGLATTVHSRSSGEGYVGFLDHAPSSAKRDPLRSFRASSRALEVWAEEQISILGQEGATAMDWCLASFHLANLGIDPLPIARALFAVDGRLGVLTLQQCLEAAISKGIAMYKTRHIDIVDNINRVTPYRGLPTFVPVENGEYIRLNMEGDHPQSRFSFIGCLFRYAERNSAAISIDIRETLQSESVFGPRDALVVRAFRSPGA